MVAVTCSAIDSAQFTVTDERKKQLSWCWHGIREQWQTGRSDWDSRQARRHHSPRRATPGARTGAPPPLHAASAPSPQALSIFRPARPHAAPASAELQAQPAVGSRLRHAGPSVSAGSRGRHARATAGAPRADSRVPPGTRGSSSRPRLRAHPALHPRWRRRTETLALRNWQQKDQTFNVYLS